MDFVQGSVKVLSLPSKPCFNFRGQQALDVRDVLNNQENTNANRR